MDERMDILRKYNLWTEGDFDFGFMRVAYTGRIMDYVGNRLVKVLIGQRRAGKSYVLRQIARELIRNGVPPQNTLFINRELSDFAFLKTHKDLEELVTLYKSELHPQGRIYIFIDEVQLIEEWEKSVNSYSQDYTEEYELFISGSNSRMLSGELATLLSGRYVQFPVYPFSYQEYTEIRHLEQNRESYMGYMNTGGIPELFVLPEKQEVQRNYLSALKDTILLKDISQRYSIRDPRLLEDLFAFLVGNASNLVSIGNIVNYFKSQGRKTSYDAVAAYIGYIEDSFLAYRCERFDLRGKEILSGTAKYYINDLVFKNFLYPGTAYGVGYKLENLVYLELLRAGYDVYTGCAKEKEVDFIARKGDRTIYLQSTYMLVDEQTVRREYASLEAIQDNYEKLVVSLDDFCLPSNEGIWHVRAWELHGLL